MVDDGEYQSAIELCEKGLSSHPRYAFGYFILGTAHYHIKNYTDAKRSLEKSLAYDPNNPRAWEILSAINEILNLTDDARESNLQSYLVDALREDASSQFIPDVEFREGEAAEADLPQLKTNASPLEAKDEDIKTEEMLDSIVAEGESEFDFDKALDEVFRDKESTAIETETTDSSETDIDEIDEIQESDTQKGQDMVSAEEFTSAIESFFDAHDEEKIEAVTEGEEPTISADPIEEISGEFTEPPDSENFESEEMISETAEKSSAEFTVPEDEKIQDTSTTDSVEEDSAMNETKKLLKEALSEEYAIEELTDRDQEEEITGDTLKDEDQPDKTGDDELLDFKSFVSDVISDSTDKNQAEVKSPDIPTDEASDSTAEPKFGNMSESLPEDLSGSENYKEKPSDSELPEGEYDFPKEQDFDLPDLSAEIPDISADAIQLEDSTDESSDSETYPEFSRPPILSPTLGEIYIAQGRFDEAVSVFQQLLAKDPQNSRLQRKIDDLKNIIAKKKMQS
jgi:tetratricopeptide (TPR) repeat protein